MGNEALKPEVTARSAWLDANGEVRVMAVCDGYVMARRPTKTPFIWALSQWHARFRPKPVAPPLPSGPDGKGEG